MFTDDVYNECRQVIVALLVLNNIGRLGSAASVRGRDRRGEQEGSAITICVMCIVYCSLFKHNYV